MTKYRVVSREDYYIVEKKVLFFWITVDNLSEFPMQFHSVYDAEKAIKKWNRGDTVVKEVG